MVVEPNENEAMKAFRLAKSEEYRRSIAEDLGRAIKGTYVPVAMSPEATAEMSAFYGSLNNNK